MKSRVLVLARTHGSQCALEQRQTIHAQIEGHILDEDIEVAIAGARIVCPCFDQLDGPRKTVIGLVVHPPVLV